MFKHCFLLSNSGEEWGEFADASDWEETVWVLSPYLLTVVSAGSAKPTF